jgi:FMN phosphatase YigB (HAD superfamily)
MKTVLFVDWDGTLTQDLYWRSMEPAYHKIVQSLLFGVDTRRVHAWMRGGCTAEEVNRWLALQLGLPFQQVWDVFVQDCRTMQVDTELLMRLHALRGHVTTVLMTGNMDSFTRFTVPALGLERYFDHISVSFDEGMHKSDNDGELFLKYSNLLGIPIDACALVDDNSEICRIFRRLGGTAHQVSSPLETYRVVAMLEEKYNR